MVGNTSLVAGSSTVGERGNVERAASTVGPGSVGNNDVECTVRCSY